MKIRKLYLSIILFAFLLQNCSTPLKTLTIETINPSAINFPGNFNKIAFINFENDFNGDGEIDSLLYKIITNEMAIGFRDATYSAAGIDTSSFLYVNGYPDKDKFYYKDTMDWEYLDHISGNKLVDIFIVLDSIKLTMDSDQYAIDFYEPIEYYIYRELSVRAHWKVFDLVERKQLDEYIYADTLLWDGLSYFKSELKKNLPSVERSIRETSYFTALDYANRIFPNWQKETRYYFDSGNLDFEKAAKMVEQNKWTEAAELWDKYIDDIDREIASRATFNMALASEILGELELALKYAERSYKIKSKSRTKYYIYTLQKRLEEFKQLQNQI